MSRCLSSRNAGVSLRQEKLLHQLRHPGRAQPLDLKAKDLIGHL